MKHTTISLSLLSVLSISTLCFGMNQESQQQVILKAFFQDSAPELFKEIEDAKKEDAKKEEGKKKESDKKAAFRKYLNTRCSNASDGLTSNPEHADKSLLDLESEYVFLSGSLKTTSMRAQRIGLPPQTINLYAQTIDDSLSLVTYIKLGCYPDNISDSEKKYVTLLTKISCDAYEKRKQTLYANNVCFKQLHVEASKALATILLEELGEETK